MWESNYHFVQKLTHQKTPFVRELVRFGFSFYRDLLAPVRGVNALGIFNEKIAFHVFTYKD